MHIVCVAADIIPGKLGGAEVHAVEVIKRLSRKHHISLFVGGDDSIKSFFNDNVTVVPISYPKIPNFYGLSYILFGYRQIYSQLTLHTSPPDLIWAKQSYPQAVLAARLKQNLKVPLYITAQNPRLLYEELVVKGQAIQPIQRFMADLLDPLIRWAYRQSDCVAAVSQYAANLAKTYGAKTVEVIPNAISPLAFKMHQYSIPQTWTLCTSSSLIPRNGIDTLIEAVALLPESLSWKLLIAGDGPLFEKVKLKIKYLHMDNYVRLLGRVDNRDIPRLLQKSDIFIRPSRFEGFGVALIEAMAAGVPVIATPVGGIIDFITDKETGLLVPVDNPQAVSQAIMTLIQNPSLYKHIQGQGLNLARKRYNWDAVTRKVESAMSKLV